MATSSGPRRQSSSVGGSAERPPIKFARRTSSGRVVSLSRDDELDVPGDYATQNDYINYTVMMPPTPDNQPAASSSANAFGDKPDGPTSFNAPPSRFRTDSQHVRTGSQVGNEDGGGNMAGKLDRRMSVMKNNNKSMLLRSQTQDFDHNRWLFETKGKYGIGNAFWQQDEDSFDHDTGMSMQDFMDKPWKPLTRKIKVPAGVLSPYRCKFIYSSLHIDIYKSFITTGVVRVIILVKMKMIRISHHKSQLD